MTFSTRWRRTAAVLLALLLLWAAGLVCRQEPTLPTAAGSTARAAVLHGRPDGGDAAPQTGDDETLRLTLHRGQGAADQPFRVENMLPGDVQSRLYCVRVYRSQEITLHFTVKNLRSTGELEQALCLRVTRLDDGAVLCDGPAAEVLGAVYSTVLPGDSSPIDSRYRVEAYLPTAAGNEYQQTRLLVDLEWYCEEDGLTRPGGLAGLAAGLLPQTGDGFPYGALLLAAALSLCGLAWLARRRACPAAMPEEAPPPEPVWEQDPEEQSTARRMLRQVLAVLLLLCLLAATTFALAAASVQVEDNRFETARVELALFKGAEHPLAGTVDALAEPGKTLIHTFELVNNSTVDVYCRLYLDRAEGPLCDCVTFTVAADGQTYTASASAFTRRQAYSLPQPLAPGERRTVEVCVTMPAHVGNAAQNAWLTYSLAADATQTRNNPAREF